jgi:hypothetical protein
MKPAVTGREAAEDEELLMHDWRVARLAQFRGWPCASSAESARRVPRLQP